MIDLQYIHTIIFSPDDSILKNECASQNTVDLICNTYLFDPVCITLTDTLLANVSSAQTQFLHPRNCSNVSSLGSSSSSSGREGTTLELGDGAVRHWHQDSSLGDHIPLLETGCFELRHMGQDCSLGTDGTEKATTSASMILCSAS